jgi:hypothetical protein
MIAPTARVARRNGLVPEIMESIPGGWKPEYALFFFSLRRGRFPGHHQRRIATTQKS